MSYNNIMHVLLSRSGKGHHVHNYVRAREHVQLVTHIIIIMRSAVTPGLFPSNLQLFTLAHPSN